ncbi:6-phosphogluconate dehydrogenase-like protein NAD-binding protein [Lentithecium fluviatile CBS 122367]|uniref:6-phosphogluconate dehydrogenase-like protein NAD-binding protein n=1 Tax=Lentithecium fluviatile CBS 122367 TaxID=1168545 RepID=A0A6G1JLV7_9PLEO|nr:6-phosphogluconate dehydrogenase-like protein NAD-binding protein [Lentithecium fluviatile CBS 122367]
MAFTNDLQLGWIGLGSMGFAMATNIQTYLSQSNQLPLHYTNRTLSRGNLLKEDGGVPCQSVRELVQKSDVVFISVSDDEALTTVVKEILDSGTIKDKIFVDTTTAHPNTTTTVTSQFTSADASYIAAPVFGATPLAQAGQLLISVAGPAPAISTITPFLQGVLARAVINVGPDPSKALLLKTTSNFITAGLMYLLSEAHTLTEKADLPASVLESLIEQNFGAYAHGVSKRLTSGSYYPAEGQAPSSGLELGIKDIGHGLSVAEERGMKLEVGELSMRAMVEAKSYGDERGKRLDSSSVFGVVRKWAGLEFETGVVRERDGVREKVGQ